MSDSNTQILDTETIEMLKEVLEGEFPSLIETFLQDAPVQVNKLKEGLAQNDIKLIEQASHTLKGSSANVGAQRLAELSERLTTQCRSDSLQDPEAQIEGIEEMLKTLEPLLKAYL